MRLSSEGRTSIVEVTAGNIDRHPQAVCFMNPSHEHYRPKVSWLRDQFKTGLKIKLLYLKDEKRPVGFIEYVPGEHCWRAVRARGYMFIHCLWTTGKKHQGRGLGTMLIKDVEKDAKGQGMRGVAVLTSDGPFMAHKDIFIKNGYKVVSEIGGEQLLAKTFKSGPRPALNVRSGAPPKPKGLSLVYSKQCPWVARFIEEVKPILKRKGIRPKVTELRTAAQAQKVPSAYGVFNLIYGGRLLADRYISTTRFLNILKKDIGI